MRTRSYSVSHFAGLARSLVIYYGQPWKLRRMRRLYARWIRPNSLCFDIGAHVGNRSFVWQRMGARVIALEPQPLLADWLDWQFGRNERVTCQRAAVGSSDGTLTLHVSPRTPTVSSVATSWLRDVQQVASFQQVRWSETVSVPQTTLDALINLHGIPDFCKIDVEGHELAVLQGVSQPLPALSFEVIGAARLAGIDCVTRLTTLGNYRYAVMVGERQQLGHWMDSAEIVTHLHALPSDGPSIDVFAELVTLS